MLKRFSLLFIFLLFVNTQISANVDDRNNKALANDIAGKIKAKEDISKKELAEIIEDLPSFQVIFHSADDTEQISDVLADRIIENHKSKYYKFPISPTRHVPITIKKNDTLIKIIEDIRESYKIPKVSSCKVS